MKPITALLLAAGILSPSFVLAATPAPSAKTQKAGAPAAAVKVTSIEGITEYKLANGLDRKSTR